MENAVLRIPALEETGIRKFYNGPESFTPGQPVHPRRGARGAELLRRRRLQLGRHRLRRRRRAARWPSGSSSGEPTIGPHQRRHPPLRALQRQQPLAARPRRRGARAALRDPVAQPRDAHGAAVPPLPALRPPGARPNANFGSKMGWERANFFAPPGTAPDIEYSWDKPNWLPWFAAEHANTRENVTVFDQTSFSKYLARRPRRRGGAPVAVHRGRRGARRAAPSTPGCSTSAAPTSPT